MDEKHKNYNVSSEKKPKKVKNDAEQGQIGNVIGDFGKYQFLIFMFKILIGVTSAFNNLSVSFFAPSDFVSYWCANTTALTGSNLGPTNINRFSVKPTYHDISFPLNRGLLTDDDSFRLSNKEFNFSRLETLKDFIYNEERKNRHRSKLNYDTPKKIKKECTYVSPTDNKQYKCTSYSYNTGIWISTIIEEWNLVCDRAWFVSVTQSLFMSGFIVSYLMFGYISDRFGRWRSLLLGATLEIGSGFGCAFASSVTWFMVFRFLLGLGSAGRTSSSYLIMIEWCGPKWRMYISTLGSLGWCVGYCVMPWLTMYFLHWRHMQLFVCFYELIFLIWFLTLPESPRWLLAHKRFDEAYDVLLMAAKFNGLIKKDPNYCLDNKDKNSGKNKWEKDNDTDAVINMDNMKAIDLNPPIANVITLKQSKFDSTEKLANYCANDLESSIAESPPNTLEPYTQTEFDIKFKHLVKNIVSKEFTENENNLSILDLFKWKNLRRYTLILSFHWAANSFIYYGIALHGVGGTNLFTSFTIAGITELPSIAFTIICMKFLPRKTANVFLFATVGLLCALQAVFQYNDQQMLQQGTIMLAKLVNSCSFVCILYQTMELFPTSIRQTAYCSCCLAGRIGSVMAPFIKELSSSTNALVPPMIYALLSLLEALLVARLPETKGSDLTDTLLEAEKFEGTDKKKTSSDLK